MGPKKVVSRRKMTKEEKTENQKRITAALLALLTATGIYFGSKAIKNGSDVKAPVQDSEIVSTEKQDNTQSIVKTEINNVADQNNDDIKEEEKIGLGTYVKISNGSTIHERSDFTGKSGIIGTNGYDDDTLFKVNAITLKDGDKTVSYNLVQKGKAKQAEVIKESKEYMKQHPNSVVTATHITPCDDLGIPYEPNPKEAGFGGWIKPGVHVSIIAYSTILDGASGILGNGGGMIL